MTFSRIVEVASNRRRNRIRPSPILLIIAVFALLLFLTKIASANQNDIKCLADNAAYEAAGHGVTAMANVIEVTLNRVGQKSVCEIVYERTDGVCQFSWVCNTRKRVLTDREKNLALHIAHSALYGGVRYHSSFAEKALFFCVPKACQKWHEKSPLLIRVGYDGAHVYYKVAS